MRSLCFLRTDRGLHFRAVVFGQQLYFCNFKAMGITGSLCSLDSFIVVFTIGFSFQVHKPLEAMYKCDRIYAR